MIYSVFGLKSHQIGGKSFLTGNMYRPPNSKVEFNDKFENFIDCVMREEKEIILIGDCL